MKTGFILATVTILCPCLYTNGHVTLKFPPARKYAFDFMDNIRTVGPCGIPKGLGPITDLVAGQQISLQWHLAYPHVGGYRIALLDANEREINNFTAGFVGAGDPTTLSHVVNLPNSECRNCSIQLIRQAGEWSTGGCGNYIFYTCADVNILPSFASNNKCKGHSKAGDGTCICNRTYTGDQCSFKDDCLTNVDCNNNGMCKRLATTYFPSQQCFCNRGWYGRNCQYRSAISEKITDFSSYIMTKLSPEYKLYHKIIPETDEIEMVLHVKSTTWVGIGWRPTSFRSGCQYFPHIPGLQGGTSGPTPRPEISSTSEPEPEVTRPAPPGPPACGGQWKSCNNDQCDYHVQWDYDNSKDEISFLMTARVNQSQWAAVGFSNDQTMPSSDVYIGWVGSDGQIVVSDRWASGRTVPMVDMTQQDATNVRGRYFNGILSVAFTRKRNTGDSTYDIMFTDTFCPYFLFAYGGNVQPNMSGYSFTWHTNKFISPQRICVKACDPTPEPSSGPVRPSPSPSTNPHPACGNKFEFCENGTCFNRVIWNYDRLSDEITFTVSAREQPSKWIGVGFSDQQGMSNSDIYMGWYNQTGGNFVIRDRHAYGTMIPPKDATQNIVPLAGSYNGTWLSFTFKRKRITNDSTDQDYQFADNKCPYILLASGGTYNGPSDKPTNMHTRRTHSPNRICIPTCGETTSAKQGMCPAVSDRILSTCVEECSADNHCTGNLKCCYNGCGHTCMDAVTEPESETTPVPESEVRPEPTGESEAEPTGESEAEPTGEPEGEGEPRTCGSRPAGNSDTTGNNPHAMDCVDMVVATATAEHSRIGDFYAHGRSTPMYDAFYGGTESLTAAYGYEENGYTTIIFRKNMSATERSDLPILNEHMHVIWARGQDQGNYNHNPPTGIDRTDSSHLQFPDYYREDEFKYHGHSNHRGVTRINFREAANNSQQTGQCSGSWGTCPDGNCHRVTWSYENNMISFTVTADLEADQWVGLGFNDQRQMANADAIIGWVTGDGQVTVMDMKNPAFYSPPVMDNVQNIQDIQGTRANGRTTISFKRPSVTSDSADFQFSETNCAYFIYAKGGDFNSQTQTISRHDQTPIISTNKVCFPCRVGGTASPPANHMYVVQVKITGHPYNSLYSDKTSQEYRNLKNEVETEIKRLFDNSSRFQSLWIIRFFSGSIVAELGIEMAGDEAETIAEINSKMTVLKASGRLGGYNIDKSFSHLISGPAPVARPTQAPTVTEEEEEVHIAVWFIVAITCATLFIILIMGFCNKIKNKEQQSKEVNKKYVYVSGDQRSGHQYEKMSGPPSYHKEYILNPSAKPQQYEQWIAGNKPVYLPEKIQYENPGYTEEEYKIETTFM